jgi:hypothetical protein
MVSDNSGRSGPSRRPPAKRSTGGRRAPPQSGWWNNWHKPIVAIIGGILIVIGSLHTLLHAIPPLRHDFCNALSLSCAASDAKPDPTPPAVQAYLVQVNDLLPRFKQIEASLKTEKIQMGPTFGSTSLVPEKRPDKFVIAIGPNFPITIFQQILLVCLKNDLDGLKLVTDPHNYGSLYIGAYAYMPFTPMTNQLKESLLSNGLSWAELKQLVNAD